MTTHFLHISAAGFRRLLRGRSGASCRASAHARAAASSIVRVDDPDGGLRIVAARGFLDGGGLDELWRQVAGLAAGDQVHLELTDAIIVGPATMGNVGVLADVLEAHGVVVRIVGVDPDHPAIPHSG